jgi:Zn-finger nucleic acid-binding protein
MSKRIHTEDEWFAKHEKDLIEDLKRERLRRDQRIAEALQKEEARKRRELHWLHCPKCGSQMHDEILDQNFKIERCSLCGGLFFDRAELEQILLQREPKGFRPGFINLLLPSWKTHDIDLEKALAEFHADQEQRSRMLAEKMADPGRVRPRNCTGCIVRKMDRIWWNSKSTMDFVWMNVRFVRESTWISVK